MNRVLSIPGRHPYVDRCLPPGTSTAGSPTAVPSPAFESGWLLGHGHRFDLVHLHFGFEHLSLEALRAWLHTLDRIGLPLVLTVHDLRNPHLDNNSHHERQLGELIRAAAAVVTLTPGAAAEIQRRWDRTVPVVPHPQLIDPGERPIRQAPGGLVGIHLKDLRRNVVEPGRVVQAVATAAARAHGRLRVDVHPGVLDRPELRAIQRLDQSGDLDLRVHERFTDRELAAYLAGLDVCVLPYRFGTHSGWLEACRDVGTRVVAPSCGFFRDQWDEVISYRCDERTGLDEADLVAAVAEALRRPPIAPASDRFRREQLATIQAHHRELYASLTARPTARLDEVGLEPVA